MVNFQVFACIFQTASLRIAAKIKVLNHENEEREKRSETNKNENEFFDNTVQSGENLTKISSHIHKMHAVKKLQESMFRNLLDIFPPLIYHVNSIGLCYLLNGVFIFSFEYFCRTEDKSKMFIYYLMCQIPKSPNYL